MYLLITFPSGVEWIFALLLLSILVLIPFICYRRGYRAGKRDGELEARRRVQTP
jgi:hypothetical protein